MPVSNSMFPDLKGSPLRTAADDAEQMADKLAKDPEFQRLGVPVYVVHDRTSSRVFVGSFDSPTRPAGIRCSRAADGDGLSARRQIHMLRARGKNALDTMIVPALALTDVSDIKTKVQK